MVNLHIRPIFKNYIKHNIWYGYLNNLLLYVKFDKYHLTH